MSIAHTVPQTGHVGRTTVSTDGLVEPISKRTTFAAT